ncbi:hypothetical protein COU95_01065 [Candidatus Shapirobacteria bacterium CG10_big_fil_rev_8_21_14_0_10_40_9]|uniref:TrbC/VIRB2 family protein n=1 Tax=Candidatus Shapirobacteria bacterium CG10_big_fil_rev_8_21_14_0_10_40_9 TaxID=1974888 RepID=A0A2M8L420_9BACT|nr:MAG: hypothetical protein COU95_01065 [Candidatus Shapirobacteria bacterium CG10_big_fil_rev_8_21_14_0_10_40_9]
MKKIFRSLGLATIGVLGWATPVFAADIGLCPPESPEKWNILCQISFGGIVPTFVNLILVIGAIVFFFMLVIGGIQWMVSGGDKAATESARGRITAALIGLVIVFSAWAILKIIETLFGISLTTFKIPVIPTE